MTTKTMRTVRRAAVATTAAVVAVVAFAPTAQAYTSVEAGRLLSPCLPYLTNSANAPSSQCASSFRSLRVASKPANLAADTQAIYQALKSTQLSISPVRAAALPAAVGVPVFPAWTAAATCLAVPPTSGVCTPT
ncbi:hypothetical protein ACFV2V_31190 [Streptomyces sp. NPDC059698]|uniref:hypothetical protein n=1 Tax=Streptomyces TaxID=1883 RepID=UPI0009681AB8|nr:hypothetical protein [Streptomyces sp. CB02366]OKJ29868.1 hypothetical protein AMK24_29520 [Streptomyces sp. CB02366]